MVPIVPGFPSLFHQVLLFPLIPLPPRFLKSVEERKSQKDLYSVAMYLVSVKEILFSFSCIKKGTAPSFKRFPSVRTQKDMNTNIQVSFVGLSIVLNSFHLSKGSLLIFFKMPPAKVVKRKNSPGWEENKSYILTFISTL